VHQSSGWHCIRRNCFTARKLLSRPPHRKRSERGLASGCEGVCSSPGPLALTGGTCRIPRTPDEDVAILLARRFFRIEKDLEPAKRPRDTLEIAFSQYQPVHAPRAPSAKRVVQPRKFSTARIHEHPLVASAHDRQSLRASSCDAAHFRSEFRQASAAGVVGVKNTPPRIGALSVRHSVLGIARRRSDASSTSAIRWTGGKSRARILRIRL